MLSTDTLPPRAAASASPALPLLALASVVLPTVLAYNEPPSATFYNQAVALVGWGALCVWLTLRLDQDAAAHASASAPGRRAPFSALIAALALVALASLAAPWWTGLPHSLSLSCVGSVAAAGVVVAVGWRTGLSRWREDAFSAFCAALAVAGVLSTLIGLVQVFAPSWADGVLVAAPSSPGRAVGNMRQPNHLSSLLLWSMIAVVWLVEARRLNRNLAALLALVFVFTLVLTASRTGVVGVGLLALWGLADRRLSRATRAMLVLAPVVYFLAWSGLAAWAHDSFGGESRLTDTADSPNSRRHIWANTLALIAGQPWVGVGSGEFNFAWSLTPFPGRPTAFFDHTHDLPLQLLVELGIPLAALVLALLAYALWQAFGTGRRAAPEDAPMWRAAFMIVLMIAVHSLLEYPLWYTYFLLPTAFAWGLCLAQPATPQALRAGRSRGRGSLLIASCLVCIGGVLSVWDYHRVVVIFAPGEQAAPLSQRIAEGQRSWFFAHHAHYAAATIAEHPSEALPSFASATHYLLDTRLMMAWAKALHEAGDSEKARYIAQRLREFRNPDSADFFAACDAPPAGGPLPFQCTPPARDFSYRDFR